MLTITYQIGKIMSSGLDVYLENVAQKRNEHMQWLEKNTRVSVSHNERIPVNVNNEKQQENITYYLRINKRGLSWGMQRQIDDNIKITYDKTNDIIVSIDQL